MKKKKKKTAAAILSARAAKLKKKAVKKVLVTVVLPGAVTVLGTAAVKTWLRIMLRRIGENAEPEAQTEDAAAVQTGDATAETGTATAAQTGNAAAVEPGDATAPQTGDAAAEPANGETRGPWPVPVTLPSSRPEFITPEPVQTTVYKS